MTNAKYIRMTKPELKCCAALVDASCRFRVIRRCNSSLISCKTSIERFHRQRIVAIATNTLTELTRQKVFYVLLIFALVLIGSSVFMARFTFQQEFQILKDVSLGAMSIFSSLLAIVATRAPHFTRRRRPDHLHDPGEAGAAV